MTGPSSSALIAQAWGSRILDIFYQAAGAYRTLTPRGRKTTRWELTWAPAGRNLDHTGPQDLAWARFGTFGDEGQEQQGPVLEGLCSWITSGNRPPQPSVSCCLMARLKAWAPLVVGGLKLWPALPQSSICLGLSFVTPWQRTRSWPRSSTLTPVRGQPLVGPLPSENDLCTVCRPRWCRWPMAAAAEESQSQ